MLLHSALGAVGGVGGVAGVSGATPFMIGNNDTGNCHTEARSIDVRTNTKLFVVGGVTESKSLVYGSPIDGCFSSFIPFVQQYSAPATTDGIDYALEINAFFNQSLYFEGQWQRYTDIKTVRFNDYFDKETQRWDDDIQNKFNYFYVWLKTNRGTEQILVFTVSHKKIIRSFMVESDQSLDSISRVSSAMVSIVQSEQLNIQKYTLAYQTHFDTPYFKKFRLTLLNFESGLKTNYTGNEAIWKYAAGDLLMDGLNKKMYVGGSTQSQAPLLGQNVSGQYDGAFAAYDTDIPGSPNVFSIKHMSATAQNYLHVEKLTTSIGDESFYYIYGYAQTKNGANHNMPATHNNKQVIFMYREIKSNSNIDVNCQEGNTIVYEATSTTETLVPLSIQMISKSGDLGVRNNEMQMYFFQIEQDQDPSVLKMERSINKIVTIMHQTQVGCYITNAVNKANFQIRRQTFDQWNITAAQRYIKNDRGKYGRVISQDTNAQLVELSPMPGATFTLDASIDLADEKSGALATNNIVSAMYIATTTKIYTELTESVIDGYQEASMPAPTAIDQTYVKTINGGSSAIVIQRLKVGNLTACCKTNHQTLATPPTTYLGPDRLSLVKRDYYNTDNSNQFVFYGIMIKEIDKTENNDFIETVPETFVSAYFQQPYQTILEDCLETPNSVVQTKLSQAYQSMVNTTNPTLSVPFKISMKHDVVKSGLPCVGPGCTLCMFPLDILLSDSNENYVQGTVMQILQEDQEVNYAYSEHALSFYVQIYRDGADHFDISMAFGTNFKMINTQNLFNGSENLTMSTWQDKVSIGPALYNPDCRPLCDSDGALTPGRIYTDHQSPNTCNLAMYKSDQSRLGNVSPSASDVFLEVRCPTEVCGQFQEPVLSHNTAETQRIITVSKSQLPHSIPLTLINPNSLPTATSIFSVDSTGVITPIDSTMEGQFTVDLANGNLHINYIDYLPKSQLFNISTRSTCLKPWAQETGFYVFSGSSFYEASALLQVNVVRDCADAQFTAQGLLHVDEVVTAREWEDSDTVLVDVELTRKPGGTFQVLLTNLLEYSLSPRDCTFKPTKLCRDKILCQINILNDAGISLEKDIIRVELDEVFQGTMFVKIETELNLVVNMKINVTIKEAETDTFIGVPQIYEYDDFDDSYGKDTDTNDKETDPQIDTDNEDDFINPSVTDETDDPTTTDSDDADNEQDNENDNEGDNERDNEYHIDFDEGVDDTFLVEEQVALMNEEELAEIDEYDNDAAIDENGDEFQAPALPADNVVSYLEAKKILRESLQEQLSGLKTESKGKPLLEQNRLAASIKPVIFKMSKDGTLTMQFKEKVVVPHIFSKKHQKEGKRRLSSQLDKLDFNRDLFSVHIIPRSGLDPRKLQFALKILDWEPEGIKLQFNFTNSNEVSSGVVKDEVQMCVRNKNYFRSQRNLMPMNLNEEDLKFQLPRQLPAGVKEEDLQNQADSTKNAFSALIIVQICAQVVLKGVKKGILPLFLYVQLLTYLQYYKVSLPANVEILLESLKKIVNFETLNPDGLLKLYQPGLTIGVILGDTQKVIQNGSISSSSTQSSSIFVHMIIFILMFVAFLILILLLVLCKYFSKFLAKKQKVINFVNKKLFMLKKKTLFNNIIDSVNVAYLTICFALLSKIVFKQESEDPHWTATNIFWIDLDITIMWLVIIGIPLSWVIFLVKRRLQLDDPKFEQKWGNLYKNLYLPTQGMIYTPQHIKTCQLRLLHYPMDILKRLVLIPLILSLGLSPFFELVALLWFQKFHMAWIAHTRPFYDYRMYHLEIFNQVIYMFCIYSMICFTDLINDQLVKYHIGSGYMYITAMVIFINLAFILYFTVKDLIYSKNMDKLKKNKEDMILKRKNFGRMPTTDLALNIPKVQQSIEDGIREKMSTEVRKMMTDRMKTNMLDKMKTNMLVKMKELPQKPKDLFTIDEVVEDNESMTTEKKDIFNTDAADEADQKPKLQKLETIEEVHERLFQVEEKLQRAQTPDLGQKMTKLPSAKVNEYLFNVKTTLKNAIKEHRQNNYVLPQDDDRQCEQRSAQYPKESSVDNQSSESGSQRMLT